MGRGKDISSDKKQFIASLLRGGKLNQCEIAKAAKVSRTTVCRIAKNVKENVSPDTSRRQHCRGKRKTTPRTDRKIVATALLHRRASTRVINQILKEEGINISHMTLRRRFYESGLKCRRPARKPKLTERMKKSRREWAKQYEKHTVTDWQKVIFSDECRIESVTEGALYVRRRAHEKYKDECLVKTVKHPPAVMIWSCISEHGPGPLYFVEGTMNQHQYRDMLENVFLPYLRRISNENTLYTFMHDGAPCHTAKSVKKYIEEQSVQVLPWCGNSPDLNPIENCWAVLKSKIRSFPNPNTDVLKKRIVEIWENDKDIKKTIFNCINSMPARIKEVLKAKGGVTRF